MRNDLLNHFLRGLEVDWIKHGRREEGALVLLIPSGDGFVTPLRIALELPHVAMATPEGDEEDDDENCCTCYESIENCTCIGDPSFSNSRCSPGYCDRCEAIAAESEKLKPLLKPILDAALARVNGPKKRAPADASCPECWGTGYSKGVGAPCSKGCTP
jgi:hypothetical protein